MARMTNSSTPASPAAATISSTFVEGTSITRLAMYTGYDMRRLGRPVSAPCSRSEVGLGQGHANHSGCSPVGPAGKDGSPGRGQAAGGRETGVTGGHHRIEKPLVSGTFGHLRILLWRPDKDEVASSILASPTAVTSTFVGLESARRVLGRVPGRGQAGRIPEDSAGAAGI